MNTITSKAFFAALAFLALAGSAQAQNSANASAQVNVDVICPIAIVNQSNLYFGTLIGGTGTAHVTGGGSESYTGNIFAGTHSGSHASAQFVVTGESGFTYGVTRIPASGTLTVTDGAGHSAQVQLDAELPVAGTLGQLTSCAGTGGASGQDVGGTGGDINHGNDGHGGTGGNGGNDNGNHGQGNNGNGNGGNGGTGSQSVSVDGGGCCGTQTFNVGGVITLTGSQPPGDYSNANAGGSAWVETVTYN